MERIQEHSTIEPKEMSPEALHAWIVEELGDSELATKVDAHPELTEQYVQGEGYPSLAFFELTRNIKEQDRSLEEELLSVAAHHHRFMPLTYQRIVGNLPEKSNDYFRHRNQSSLTEGVQVKSDNEQEKTQEVFACINFAKARLNEMRLAYGLDELIIDPDQLRIIAQDCVSSTGQRGTTMLMDQEIRIGSLNFPDSSLYSSVFHELVHLMGYGALQRDLTSPATILVTNYRVGISVTERFQNPAIMSDANSRKGKYSEPDQLPRRSFLKNLNEAMTEEIANRMRVAVPPDEPYIGQFFQNHHSEVSENQKHKPVFYEELHLRPHWINGIYKEENGDVLVACAYPKERNLMFDLFHIIAERNPAIFEGKSESESEEQLFEMLQKAMFTGNILPFGRLFNQTFGAGKFRKYGHLQTLEEQEEFVRNL